MPVYRRFDQGIDRETELGRESNGAQHPHRVLAQSPVGIADENQLAAFDVRDTAHVVPDTEVTDVVVERIAGEVTAPDVLIDAAVDIVANDPSLLVMLDIIALIDGSGPEGGDLDDLAAKANMR